MKPASPSVGNCSAEPQAPSSLGHSFGKRATLTAAALLAMAALSAAIAPPAVHYFLTSAAIWAIFALGFDLAFGVAGLLSFGHSVFFAAGGYLAALLTMLAGIPMSGAIPLAGLSAGILAALVGMLALRTSGVYLGLTTLAVSQLFETLVAVRLRAYTGGMEGLVGVARPAIFGHVLDDDRSYFLFVFAIFMMVLGASALLRQSHWGRGLVAMRINEVRAQQLGFNTLRLKISAFAASGAISGVAGALLASLMRFVNPEILSWTISGDVLIATLIGGAGTLLGPALGALLMSCLREVLGGMTTHWHGLLGVVLIVFTLWVPNGLAPAVQGLVRKLRNG